MWPTAISCWNCAPSQIRSTNTSFDCNRQTLNPTNLCLLPTLALLPAIFSVKYPLLNYITCVMEWKMSIETAQNKAEIHLTPVDERLLFTRRLSRSSSLPWDLLTPPYWKLWLEERGAVSRRHVICVCVTTEKSRSQRNKSEKGFCGLFRSKFAVSSKVMYRNEKQEILLSTLLQCVWGLIYSESKNDPVFVLNRNVGATNMASQEGSKIMVFRPTLEEFANFSIYIRKMEEMGAHRAGVAKVSSEKIGQICFVLCLYAVFSHRTWCKFHIRDSLSVFKNTFLSRSYLQKNGFHEGAMKT